MHSGTIGKITTSVLSERELRLLWMGLKSLKKFGLPDSVAMNCSEEEVAELLKNVTKACNQYLDRRGPLSDVEIKVLIEREKRYAHLREINPEYQAKVEQMKKDTEARWKREKQEAEDKRRRGTYFTHSPGTPGPGVWEWRPEGGCGRS